jgi:hypothetical protein
MNSGERVEFENDRIRVLRVVVGPRERHPQRARADRVLIWLTDAHETRTEPDGKVEQIERQRGDVAWRTRSEHQIENRHSEHVELIIVELKG